jgi:hypothetical protein
VGAATHDHLCGRLGEPVLVPDLIDGVPGGTEDAEGQDGPDHGADDIASHVNLLSVDTLIVRSGYGGGVDAMWKIGANFFGTSDLP